MTPYRTSGTPKEPDIVFARIPARVAGCCAGHVVVGRQSLTWEPRFAQPRQVGVGAGLAGLRLSRWLRLDPPPRTRLEDGRATVASLGRIAQTKPFESVRPRPSDQLIGGISALATGDDGETSNAGEWLGVLLGDHLVMLREGERTWNAVVGAAEAWPDASAETLLRALRWLHADALHEVVDRVLAAERINALQWIPPHPEPALERLDVERRRRAIFEGSPLPLQMIRCFTREAVAARRITGGRFHRIGPEHRCLVFTPTPSELAAIERWLAPGSS